MIDDKPAREKDRNLMTFDKGCSLGGENQRIGFVIGPGTCSAQIPDTSKTTLWTWSGIMEGWQDFKKKVEF